MSENAIDSVKATPEPAAAKQKRKESDFVGYIKKGTAPAKSPYLNPPFASIT
jgi:hypothetical protein